MPIDDIGNIYYPLIMGLFDKKSGEEILEKRQETLKTAESKARAKALKKEFDNKKRQILSL